MKNPVITTELADLLEVGITPDELFSETYMYVIQARSPESLVSQLQALGIQSVMKATDTQADSNYIVRGMFRK